MKSWDCQYKYKHLNGIWYWYDMIFWKHIQVTCYHFWRSLGLFAPCANLVTFQNSYFNEHRADCKITDEHPMNFGDRYCVKTRWIFKTWWKPGEISRPGENLVNVQKLGENLVNVQNLVKTWWIFKTWWKPGEFSKLGENLVISLSWTRRSVLQVPNSPKEVFWAYFLVKIMCFHGENGSKISLDQNLVKTWWKLGEFSKPGENLMNFKARWKLGENLVKTWWKPGENSVKTWWKPGEFWKPGENLVKTWWKRDEKKLGQNLVKTWWKPGEFSKPGENLVKTWWKRDENSVKTWWKPGEFSKPGENLVKTWSKKRSKSVWKPSAAWWKLLEIASWKPGENLMKTFDNLMKCHNLGKNLMEF